MAITFERAALYEQVWSEPLIALAKRYSLSDNGLRKICKAMNIPLPSVGHWARVAAGQQISRTPLPAQADVTTYTSHPPAQTNALFRTEQDRAWLDEQDALEERLDCVINADERPTSWHRITSMLRAKIDARLADIGRRRELAERDAKRSTRQRTPSPDFDSWRWKAFVRDGQLIMQAPLRVSQNTCERALRIVNALCYAAEARGFAVGLTSDESRIELKGHGAELSVRMAERLDDKLRREPAYAGGPLENMEVKVPTGSLKMLIGSSRRSERDVALDDSKGKLESKLKNVFLRINRLVVSSREQQRQRDAWNREWKDRQARHAALVLRKEKARKRRDTLYREVQQWQRAEAIRAYVAQVVASGAGVSPDDATLKRVRLWQVWAQDLANKIDPTARTARPRADVEPE